MKKPSRNDLCPCGSGKKFKHCCLNNLALNAVQAIHSNNATSSENTLKCEAPGCLVTIPINLGYGHEQRNLCGAAIASPPNQPKWALCPQHAKEWIEDGYGCSHLQHYRLWKTGTDFTNIIDNSPKI